MALQPLDGFPSITTRHCISGSLLRIYLHHGYPVSEEMLLGLGAGVGFIYWRTKRMPPLVGGRANARGEFEVLVGERTGVRVQSYATSSAAKAEWTMLELLVAGEPVMMLADMGFLPYLDFGGADYHFGAHGIVVCGYDAEAGQVLVADRDGLHPVPLEDLTRARGSTYQPFPPHNLWYTFDFSGQRPIAPEEVRLAIAEQVKGMLEPPIRIFGVPAIRKAAMEVPHWPEMLDADTLRATLFNSYAFIDARGGTGGGLFRYMFSRFLREAGELTGAAGLAEVAADFQHIGDRWQEVGGTFKRASVAKDPLPLLAGLGTPLLELADLEEAAWGRLGELV